MSMSERDILHAYRKTESYVMEAQHQEAVSANQLCLLGKDQFAEQVCHHKHMALQGLRRERDILHAYRKTESYVMEAQHQDRSYRGICMYTSGNFPSEPLYNPYISLLVPLCFVSITLRHAVLAVSANQLCLLGIKIEATVASACTPAEISRRSPCKAMCLW
jgi:hypothetical protein